MTVKELIKALEKMTQDAHVFHYNVEDADAPALGVVTVTSMKFEKIGVTEVHIATLHDSSMEAWGKIAAESRDQWFTDNP